MYLVFDRASRKLISFSDTLEVTSNISLENMVYYDEYSVIENRPDIDFIETNFDENMQLTTIVPGQYTLEEFKKDLIVIYEERKVIIAEGLALLRNKIAEITENVSIGYFTEMIRIGAKVAKGKASDKEKLLFQIQSNVLELGLDEKEVASKFNSEASLKLQKVNSVYTHHKKFLKDVEEATSIEDLKQYIHTLRNILTNTIPS